MSQQNPKACFIFDGAGEGKGQLVVTLHKADGTKIGDGPGVWLDLQDIKKMYMRGTAQPENISAPNGNVSGPFTGPVSYVDDPNGNPFPHEKPWDENNQALIFVHGWSMTYNAYNAYINFSETMFKRMWHKGFKGRFGAFRWDPLVANQAQLYAVEYNRSEHRAFVYGAALKQFAEALKNDQLDVSLAGHSMGNIVCGSALQQGLTVIITIQSAQLSPSEPPRNLHFLQGALLLTPMK